MNTALIKKTAALLFYRTNHQRQKVAVIPLCFCGDSCAVPVPYLLRFFYESQHAFRVLPFKKSSIPRGGFAVIPWRFSAPFRQLLRLPNSHAFATHPAVYQRYIPRQRVHGQPVPLLYIGHCLAGHHALIQRRRMISGNLGAQPSRSFLCRRAHSKCPEHHAIEILINAIMRATLEFHVIPPAQISGLQTLAEGQHSASNRTYTPNARKLPYAPLRGAGDKYAG